jgi:MFS family permease
MAFNAGFAFGPATAGFLAERGYFWLFAGDAATSVLFGVIALVLLPRGVQGRREEGGWIADLKTLTGDREFHRVLAGAFIIGLVFLQISSTFSLHITRLGFSAATYGMILSLNGVLVTFCELPMTSLTGRFRPWHMMALGYVLIAIGFAGNAFAHSVPALVGCVVIFTFGEMATFPVSSAYIAGLAPAHLRGRYMGAYALVWSAGLIAAPQMGLRLFAVGPKTLWLTCGALGVIAAAIAFRGPVKRRDAVPMKRQEISRLGIGH